MIRWMGYGAALILVLATPIWLVSCLWQPAPARVPTALPSPVAAPTLLPVSPPIPTPVPTSGPLPSDISQQEAQTLVRAWFASVLAQDYETAAAMTAGSATDRTRDLSEGFQRATGGNPVELSERRLDLAPAESPPDVGQSVKADFDIQVNARMGPIMLAVQQLQGGAVFVVQRVENRTRITDIRDVTGLPAGQ